jgi:hypothetical protein
MFLFSAKLEYQYEWGGRTRWPLHRDHVLPIVRPYLISDDSWFVDQLSLTIFASSDI